MGNEGTMCGQLQGLGTFVRQLKLQARFGALSRARLRLLRVQIEGERAECDWLARPPDVWDSNLPAAVGKRNASVQALKDAIAVRQLLFRALPELQDAALRVYRQTALGALELIIAGTVTRAERPSKAVRSLAMRAKLLGLRFWMDEGVLENLHPHAWAANF